MRLLCTNDDGILAHGLDCLVRAATSLGEVTVVAPDREQSATSHSLTLHHPIRPVARGERRYQVDEAQLARAVAQLADVGATWDARLRRIKQIAEAIQRSQEK